MRFFGRKIVLLFHFTDLLEICNRDWDCVDHDHLIYLSRASRIASPASPLSSLRSGFHTEEEA